MMYDIFDLDGNGKISSSELGVALRALVGHDIPQEKVREIFEMADVNHDGAIDFSEFCAVLARYKTH
jgi:Ca2+-binding EF-hand superfamily protein